MIWKSDQGLALQTKNKRFLADFPFKFPRNVCDLYRESIITLNMTSKNLIDTDRPIWGLKIQFVMILCRTVSTPRSISLKPPRLWYGLVLRGETQVLSSKVGFISWLWAVTMEGRDLLFSTSQLIKISWSTYLICECDFLPQP